MIRIYQDTLDQLGFDLDAAVKDFSKAWKNHAKSINVPAPTAHPLVEALVKKHAGQYEIVESPETDEKPGDPKSMTNQLFNQVNRIVVLENFCNNLLTALKNADIKKLESLNSIDLIQPGTDKNV